MAVLVSAPLAFGIGYMYFRKPAANTKPSDRNPSQPRSVSKSSSIDSDGKTTAADGQPAKPITPKTPLDQAVSLKNEGNSCFRYGKFNDAIKLYDRAIEQCPRENKLELATFYQNRAAAYEQLKKWSMVKADCTAALDLNPSYAKALTRRAKAHESLSAYKESLEDVTAACILEGFRNDTSLTYADRVLKKLGECLRVEFLFVSSVSCGFSIDFCFKCLCPF